MQKALCRGRRDKIAGAILDAGWRPEGPGTGMGPGNPGCAGCRRLTWSLEALFRHPWLHKPRQSAFCTRTAGLIRSACDSFLY